MSDPPPPPEFSDSDEEGTGPQSLPMELDYSSDEPPPPPPPDSDSDFEPPPPQSDDDVSTPQSSISSRSRDLPNLRNSGYGSFANLRPGRYKPQGMSLPEVPDEMASSLKRTSLDVVEPSAIPPSQQSPIRGVEKRDEALEERMRQLKEMLIPAEVTQSLKKSGFLSKRGGGLLKSTKSRYFNVTSTNPGAITYYSSEAQKKELGRVNLTNANINILAGIGFTITPSSEENNNKDKVYTLECPDEKLQTEWLKVLENHGAHVHWPLKTGVLLKTGSAMRSWYDRFFVLYKDRLVYYKAKGEEKALGEIELPGGAELETKLEGDSKLYETMFSIARNGDADERRYFIRGRTTAEKEDWTLTLRALLCTKNSDIHPNSIKEGYLFKTKRGGGAWTKRYFVLLQDRLLYFKRKDDVKNNDVAGFVPLPGGMEVELEDAEDGAEQQFLFSVAENGDEASRKYVLAAKNDTDRVDWLRTLYKLSQTKNHRVREESLKEGYLFKCSANQSRWRKRYFILLVDKLLYYKSRNDAKECGSIPLPGGFEADIQEERPHMFSVARNGDFSERKYFLVARSEEERSQWLDALAKLWATKTSSVHPDSLKEGYLWKTGSDLNNVNWKKRYFVLLNDRLSYYKRKDDVTDGKEAGYIDLPGGFEAEDERGETIGQPGTHLFSVARNGDEGTRKYYICAKDLKTKKNWIYTLGELWKTKNSKVHADSLKEGYLYKASSNETRWRKRFFVLFQDKLCYYSKRDDTKEAGSVELPGGAQVVYEKRPWHHCFRDNLFSVARNGDLETRKYLISAKNDKERKSWHDQLVRLLATKDSNVHPNSIKEGYLFKTGSNLNSWAKRYFVLTNDVLFYYKKKDDVKKNQPAGEIPLPGGAEVEIERDIDQMEYMFSVAENGDEETRKYYISARSQTQRSEWVTALTELLAFKNPKVMTESLKEGYLLKAPLNFAGLQGWKKNYVILMMDRLLYFKHRSDSEPAGSIPLPSGFELDSMELKDRPFLISIAESGDGDCRKYLWGARSEADRQLWLEALHNLQKDTLVPKLPNAIKEGYLFKQGASLVGRRFAKRYFVATEHCLFYYKRRHDDTPAGEIKINEHTALELGERAHSFVVVPVVDDGEKRREYTLITSDNEDPRRWLLTLKAIKMGNLAGAKRLATAPVEKKTKLFGGNVEDGLNSSVYDVAPTVLVECCKYLLRQADTVAIFKVPGNAESIHELQQQFESKEPITLRGTDVHIVCGVVVAYLSKLNEPLIPVALQENFIDAVTRKHSVSSFGSSLSSTDIKRLKFNERCDHLREAVSTLPLNHNLILNFFTNFLLLIARRYLTNKMSAQNLAAVFAPIILRQRSSSSISEMSDSGSIRDSSGGAARLMRRQKATYDVIETLITGYWQIWPNGPPAPVRKLDKEELENAKKEFELSFTDLLDDEYGLALYERYAREEFTEENILFFKAATLFKETAQEAGVEHAKVKSMATDLLDQRIRQNSEFQVNISATLCRTVVVRMEALLAEDAKLTGDEYDDVVAEVSVLISTNSFPRFKRSLYYDQLLTRKYREREADERGTEFQSSSRASTFLGNVPILKSNTTRRISRTRRRSSGASPSSAAETDANSKEWKQMHTAQGKPYYMNTRTLSTTWKPPPNFVQEARSALGSSAGTSQRKLLPALHEVDPDQEV